jgi:hypothetical protein
MLLKLCVLFGLFAVAEISNAAYQDPVVQSAQRAPGGAVKIVFQFSGDAGEPTVTREYQLGASTTAPDVRLWVDFAIKELDSMNAVSAHPSLQLGRTVLRLAPVAPIPTAKQGWQKKYLEYQRLKDTGLIGKVATDLAAIKTALEQDYQPGFLDE